MALKRRDNGAGTVYHNDTTGQWVAELRWVDKAGKMQRKTFTSKKSKTAAKNKLEDFKRQLLLQDGVVDDVTFEEYAEEWLKQEKKKLKPTSYLRKKQVYENQVLPYLGGYLMDEITTKDVQGMVDTLEESGLSYSSVKKAKEIVSACFRYYRTTTHKSINPTEGVELDKRKKKKQSDIDYFTAEERKAIVDAALAKWSNGIPIYRFGHAYLILMLTGMRLGELLALSWSDVDFGRKQVTISKNLVVVENEGEKKKTSYRLEIQDSVKHDEVGRVVPLSSKALDAFREIQKITGKNKQVISSKNNQPYTPRNFERAFAQILTRAGIDHGTVHSLRHTFASMLFEKKYPVKTVSELLGHKDTKVTENTYIHIIKEQKVQAIDDIDDF